MVSSKASANSPNGPIEFAHTQTTNAVRIDNIPEHVDRRELVALFRSLIGDVQSFRDVKERNQDQLEITFHNRAVAVKALCMNGYSIGGATLSVTAVTLQAPRSKASPDERRNLYVLGLPFALTKNEFTSLFSRYGTVSHSVILATVDNSSRRRGFVVMSTHEEARRALTALTRSQIKGHTIDVSWAVVQRSQGFLDGGDRSLLLDARSSQLPGSGSFDRMGFPSSNSDSSDYSPPLNDSGPRSSGMNTPVPTTTLLVSNLPAMLFSQIQDLHPLLCPFGRIERIQTVQIPNADTISAVVQYASSEAALEAKASLNGQAYGNVHIEAHFVHPSFGDSNDDPRAPALTSINNANSRFSPRTSRAPTPMLGLGGPRKGNTLQNAEQSLHGNSNIYYLSADPGYAHRDGFSDYTDDRAPSNPYARNRNGGFSQMSMSFPASGQGNQFASDSAYQKFAV